MDLNIQLSKENKELDLLKKHILTFNSFKDEINECLEYNQIIERADIIITTIIVKLNKMQEEFITTQVLRDISSQINSLNVNLSNFVKSNYTSYLTQANTNTDNLINLIPKLCFSDKETINESLATIVGNYKRQLTNLDKKIVNYKLQIENNEKDIMNLANLVAKQQKTIESFSQQFSDAQIKRDSSFTDKIIEYNQKISANQEIINTEWEQLQKTIESKAQEIFDKLTENNAIKNEEWIKIKEIFSSDFQLLRNTLSQETEKAIEEIAKRNNEVEKLYGLLGKNITCGNLKQLADKENKIIWILYISSLLIMLIIALLFGLSIYLDYQANHTFNWFDIFLRVPISFVFYAPAFYMAMEAKKRHNRQIELRDLEIKISAIDPYLKNIDFVESKRENEGEVGLSARDVKLELAKKLFSPKQNNTKNDNIIIPKEVIDLFEQMSKIYNSIKNNKDNIN